MKTLLIALVILPLAAHAMSGAIELPVPAARHLDRSPCVNFALSLPATALRFDGSGTHVYGPIRPLGVGAGLSYTRECSGRPSLAANAYLFSEALDFENDYQLALGATIGFRVISSVAVGVGLHYDLVRGVRGADGVLRTTGGIPATEADHRSVTWVLMLHWLLF